MSKSLRAQSGPKPLVLPFHSCRNISGPEDKSAGRTIYAGHAPASSFLKLEDNENVREYLVDAPGKQKRSPTAVHLAMRDTLYNRPDVFCVLNGGICLVAQSATLDDQKRTLTLESPSIINGSQTQGELRRYWERTERGQVRANGEPPTSDPSVKFELIVTEDENIIADISIARNFQNDVKSISIVGRKGLLDELQVALQRKYPIFELRMSESDIGDQYVDTEKLIQVLFALSPDSVWTGVEESKRLTSKPATYSQKTRCLKLYQAIAESAMSKDGKNEMPGAEVVYQYFLDMAGTAWELYEKWKVHPGFVGTRIRAVERDGRDVVDVPDGIVFPIVAAHSAFVTHPKSKWILDPPSGFSDKMLIEAASEDYKEIADHNPQSMGKSKACYSSLLRLTSIFADFRANRLRA